jgi:predicted alpha/beta hydrolase family esterase
LKRKIFYIPGFDPRSEAYYKKLLLSEFPEIKQSIVKQSSSEISYQVDEMQVDYEILSWHDSVRNYWSKGLRENACDVFNLFSEFVFKGTWKRLFRLSKRDGFQKAFSVYLLLFSLFLSLTSLFLLFGFIGTDGVWQTIVSLLLWALVNVALYLGLKTLNLFWVTRIKNFFVRYARQETPDVFEFEQRSLGKVLACLLSDEYDEVVLVAHSVGTILCLDMLADCDDTLLKKLKVVTLGHCVTGVSILKPAGWFNQKLQKLANRQFFWIDITSGKDAVNFYKVSPAYDQTIQPDLVLSAGFHHVFTDEHYRALKWRFYDVHFLYLCRPDYPQKSFFNYQKLLFDEKLFSSV